MIKYIFILAIFCTSNEVAAQFPSYSIRSSELRDYLFKNPNEDYGDRSLCDIDLNTGVSTYCSDAFGEFSIVREGETEQFVYSSGQLKLTMSRNEDGKVDGPKTVYYRDSLAVFSTWKYSNGRFEGVQFFNRSGDKLESGKYSGGNGKLIFYRQDGTVCLIAEFQDYKINGMCTMYFSNGEKMIEGNCQEGKPISEWKEWNKEGERLI